MGNTLINKNEVENFFENWSEIKTKDYNSFIERMKIRIDFIMNEIFAWAGEPEKMKWAWGFFGSNATPPDFKPEKNITPFGIKFCCFYYIRFIDKFGEEKTLGEETDKTTIPFRWLYEDEFKEEVLNGELALQKKQEEEKKIRRAKEKVKEEARKQRRIADTNRICALISEKGISIEDCSEIARLITDITARLKK